MSLLPTSISLGAGGSVGVELLCWNACSLPCALQLGPLLARAGSATVSSSSSYSSLPVPLVCFSYAFFPSPVSCNFPLIVYPRTVSCCYFCSHVCEMALLDPRVCSFLVWATPRRCPLFNLLISMLFSSPSEVSFTSQISFMRSQSMKQIWALL